MPFLIAENFKPRTGQDVVVKAYKRDDSIIAAQMTLIAEKRTVRFRDDQGWRCGAVASVEGVAVDGSLVDANNRIRGTHGNSHRA
jgi:hypothetical protein